jgi:signal transduction histidine kinase
MNEILIVTPDSHEAFERTIEMLSNSLREIRQVALQMIPESLVINGLDASLRDLCAQVKRPDDVQIVYESIGMEDLVLEPVRAAAIYHVIQELVNNSIQHAAAHKITVLLTNRNGKVWINVEDNGIGFDTAVLHGAGAQGMGWSNILSRMEDMKGRIETQSAPGRGTTIRFVFDSV